MIEWIDSQNPSDQALERLTGPTLNEILPTDTGLNERLWDLVVLGGGSAGLVGALGAAGLGAGVLLIESHRLGGDCLHSGCVPSKAILEALVHPPGQQDLPVKTGFSRVMDNMRRIRSEMAEHDSKSRLTQSGVKVAFGKAGFTGADRLVLGTQEIRFKRALIATGSRPRLPGIEGVNHPLVVNTNRIFDLAAKPDHLTILGGGPVGSELAQAFSDLGVKVTLVQIHTRLIPKDDPEASDLLAEGLRSQGIELVFDKPVKTIQPMDQGLRIDFGSRRSPIFTDMVLVATGRQANTEGLDLSKAGVKFNEKGVETNDYLCTANPRIYAAGDVTGRWQFTHASDAMARLFLRNGLIGFPFSRKKVEELTIPWITWTRPRVGGVGMDEPHALTHGAQTYRVEAKSVDRLRLSGKTRGFFKIFATKKGKILGARACGDRIEGWLGLVTQAMEQGTPLGSLADAVHPYPGNAEALKKAAGDFRKNGFTPWMKNLIRWWLSSRS